MQAPLQSNQSCKAAFNFTVYATCMQCMGYTYATLNKTRDCVFFCFFLSKFQWNPIFCAWHSRSRTGSQRFHLAYYFIRSHILHFIYSAGSTFGLCVGLFLPLSTDPHLSVFCLYYSWLQNCRHFRKFPQVRLYLYKQPLLVAAVCGAQVEPGLA